MFIPNLPCAIRKKGEPDLYGQTTTTAPPVPEKCAVVKAKLESQHTTVRADSGGSRGHADEFVMLNRILLTAKTVAGIDDRLDVVGYAIRIKVMNPRFDVMGRLDHYEVEGETWA